MGQYYKVCNVTKKQFLCPHKFGEGIKLLEFGCNGCGTMTALAVLCADGNNRAGSDALRLRSDNPVFGSWAGDKIVIAGNYADDGKFVPEGAKDEEGNPVNLFAYAEDHYEDISWQAVETICQDRYVKEGLIKRYWSEDNVPPSLRGEWRATKNITETARAI